MHYTLHQLKIFLKVAEHESITKASEDLHLTQPAVSIQLKKLQDQFELPLTEVIGRQLYITDFGREIATRCQKLLEEADGIKHTIDQYKGLVAGKIKISVVSTGKYVIPYFLKNFMEQFPHVEIFIDVSNKMSVIEGMYRNESDFSLVSVIPDDLNVHAIELMDNQLNLVGNIEYEGKIKKPKDLEKVTLLFREDGSATKNAMQTYLDSKNIKVGKSMELVSNEAVKQAIIAGLGVSIVPLIGLRTALARERIRIFPLPGLPIYTRWNLIYNKGKALTPAHKALVQFMEENKDRLVEEHFSWVKN